MKKWLVLALVSCGGVVEPVPEVVVVPPLAGLRLTTACPFPTVWEVAVDGHYGLWMMSDSVALILDVADGRHELRLTRWSPTISVTTYDSVTVPVAVPLPCADAQKP